MGLFTAVTLRASQPSTQEQPRVAPQSLRVLPAVTARGLTVASELESPLDTLWMKLRRAGVGSTGRSHQAFVVAHWEPQEGATTLALALALRAAELDPSCTFCVADFDFANPGLSSLTGLDVMAGLSNVLAGHAALDQVLGGTRLPNLYVAPAGNGAIDRQPTHWYDRCRDLCGQLIKRFNYVFLDMPALRDHRDFALWAGGLAQALLVVRAGQARRPVVAKTIQTLELIRLELAAVALNGREYYLPRWLYART